MRSAPIPTSAATAIAASALRTLCAPSSGTSKVAERRPAAPDLKSRRRARRLEVVRLPVGAVAPCRRSATRETAAACQRRARRAVGAEQQQAAARHEVDEAAERQRHRVEVRIDVRVIELDVVDDGDVGQVLQELRRLVEERAVVLVALDHEVASLPDAVARPVLAEVAGDAADEHARIERRRAVSSQPVSDVVVVLPCVPAMTIDRAPQRKCSRIASGSEQ